MSRHTPHQQQTVPPPATMHPLHARQSGPQQPVQPPALQRDASRSPSSLYEAAPASLPRGRSKHDRASVPRRLPQAERAGERKAGARLSRASTPTAPHYALRRRRDTPDTRNSSPDPLQQPDAPKSAAPGSPTSGIIHAVEPSGLENADFVCSASNVDLNSAFAARTPDLRFLEPEDCHEPIYVLPIRATQGSAVTLNCKQWLLDHFRQDQELQAPGILRLDPLNLHNMPYREESDGQLVLMQGAVHLDGNADLPVSIMAIVVKGDTDLRFLYTLTSVTGLLEKLEHLNCLGDRAISGVGPRTKKHRRLFSFLKTEFLKAVSLPEHPDYVAAQNITDYCPEMSDPSTAFDCLEGTKSLYFANNGDSEPVDLAEDRYCHILHPAESSLAADLKMRCSAYLLLKRKFFKAFWKDCVALRDSVGADDQKVRTEHTHEVWLVQETRWRQTKAKRLLLAWHVLGFLDEKRFLPWLKAGGTLEEVRKQEDERPVEAEPKPEGRHGVGRPVRRH